MAKMRKTRKDKKRADQRKESAVQPAQNIAAEKVVESVTPTRDEQKKSMPISERTPVISTTGYTYLSQDLIRTTILTAAIIITELVIKQLAFNH